jgi:hypothetical protein
MDLVEDPQPGYREFAFENVLAVFGHVPAEITPRCTR